MNPGLQHALCALSFFHSRHSRDPRFKKDKKIASLLKKNQINQIRTVSHYREWVRMARVFSCKAREAGWKGSIIKAVERGEGI